MTSEPTPQTPGGTAAGAPIPATASETVPNSPVPGSAVPDGSGMANNQLQMVHRLPKAPLVDRIAHLTAAATGRRVIHLGFADAGFRDMQARSDSWLHEHLDRASSSLVGIDIEDEGVELARSRGYEAYQANACRVEELEALAIEPADLIIAGEVIEHLEDPGAFLRALSVLIKPGGELIVTTPNSHGLINIAATLVNREINHPDHLVMYTWRTLTTLLERTGWTVSNSATYVAAVKETDADTPAEKAMVIGAKLALAVERGLSRLGANFAADGLIIHATRTN